MQETKDVIQLADATWLGFVCHNLAHVQLAEIVSLEEAALRLYVNEKARKLPEQWPDWDSCFHPRWADILEVEQRTRGQAFRFEMPVRFRAECGVDDLGPLFVWQPLWVFAGCPDDGKRPTWDGNPKCTSRHLGPRAHVRRLEEVVGSRQEPASEAEAAAVTPLRHLSDAFHFAAVALDRL